MVFINEEMSLSKFEEKVEYWIDKISGVTDTQYNDWELQITYQSNAKTWALDFYFIPDEKKLPKWSSSGFHDNSENLEELVSYLEEMFANIESRKLKQEINDSKGKDGKVNVSHVKDRLGRGEKENGAIIWKNDSFFIEARPMHPVKAFLVEYVDEKGKWVKTFSVDIHTLDQLEGFLKLAQWEEE